MIVIIIIYCLNYVNIKHSRKILLELLARINFIKIPNLNYSYDFS